MSSSTSSSPGTTDDQSSRLCPISPSNSNSKTTKPIAAIAQLRSTSDKFRNLVDVAVCARLAKSKGASMLFLPECFGFMGESSLQTLEEAEDPAFLVGETTETEMEMNNKLEEEESTLSRILKSTINDVDVDVDAANSVKGMDMDDSDRRSPVVHSLMDGLRTIAKESGLWISGGGIHVSGAPPADDDTEESGSSSFSGSNNNNNNEQQHQQQQRVYNTHVIIDSSGVLKASYRKIHLFDVSIPGKVQLQESKTTAPGTELVVCDSPVGRLGVTTCYDLRFPEMYTELVRTMGAQVLLVPSAFTIPTGAAHWHILLRARAIENQCYVLAAAQFGKHNEKRDSFGHSLAVDPWGKVVADAGGYPTTDTEVNNILTADEKNPNRPPVAAVAVAVAPTKPPSIITVEIDLTLIESIRQRMPIDLHRSNASF